MTKPSSTVRIMRRREVEAAIGLSRATIYDRINPKSVRFDATFPRPIKLGASAVGWIAAEVDQYLDHLVAKSRGDAI